MKRKHLLMLTACLVLLLPLRNFAQVTLGAAASRFVIYSSSGAISDNASAHSHLTGDVGTSTAGLMPGFGNVDGVMHPGADVATAACNLALAATTAQLNATVATMFPLTPLGGNTLTAGVHSIAGNATLVGILNLDAANVAGAQFIIKISGTFGAATNSKVVLINGAEACNVYWQIGGAVTLASLVTMRGNIFSGGAILMGSGDSLEGRAFVSVGSIGIDGITGFMPIGCSAPVLTGPAYPNTGGLNCYTLFTAIGPLNNTVGTTAVTGDVGKDDDGSAITGWTAGAVTGTLHNLRDASTIQAASDLTNLYNTLNALTPDIQLLYPAQFGNNLKLTPHVYFMSSAATFTDSLYLDAQNNPNAVFVIKIAGALTTSTYCRVKLINGAQSKNVFWIVQGAVSINNYSIFRGTIIVPVGAINLLNTGVYLDGRALTLNGAILTEGLTAVMSPGCNTNSITRQPNSLVVCLGTPAQFTVKTSMIGASYQWRKGNSNVSNSPNITGANADTLNILSATLADTSSNYYVIINGVTVDTSNRVSLMVNLPPNITVEPIPATFCLGDSIRFIVKATGPGLLYKWHKDSIPLKDTLNVSGSTNDTLTIRLLSLSDTSSFYNVVVSGTCLPNDTSLKVSLLPQTAPIILPEPQSKTVCLGDSVYLIVNASGTNLSYQWRRGNVNMLNNLKISGATTDSLKIKLVAYTDTAFNYNVIVTGRCGLKDTSMFTSLSISPPVVILTAPVSKTICQGDSVFFHVGATGSGLTYQWRKGLVNLNNSISMRGTQSDTLFINPVGILDTATNYNVVISGTCQPSVTSSMVALTFLTPPVIVSEPVNNTVCSGANVTIIVRATGSGLSYSWRKGNTILANDSKYAGVNSDTLRITNVGVADSSSFYHVRVTGLCNPADTSVMASLIVNTPPTVITEPVSQAVCIGSPAMFFIQETGTGLTYQWRKGNVNVNNTLNISGADNDTLKFAAVTLNDTSGLYSVIVTGVCAPADTSVIVSLNTLSLPLLVQQPANKNICFGSNMVIGVAATGSALTYQWRRGNVLLADIGNVSGTQTDTLRINGFGYADTAFNYNVVVSGACSPSVTTGNISLQVIELPVAVAGGTTPVCTGTTIGLYTPLVTGGTYQWSGPNAFLSNDRMPVILNASLVMDGNYTVVVTANGCNSIPSVIDIVVKVCVTDLSIVKTANSMNPLIGRNVTFTVTAYNNGPDTANDVSVSEVLQSGYTYQSSTTTKGTYDVVTGVWTIGRIDSGKFEVMTITAKVNSYGSYQNAVTVSGTESDNDLTNNLMVIEPIPTDFNIPEGFSPNGDGVNDLFVIRGIAYFPENSFTIFNRWGSKVFEANPYKNTWDGNSTTGITIGGEELPVGTYFYVIDLGDGTPVIKGTIYLNK